MDEVIDDIISMQSSYDDIQQYIDPLQTSNTVSIKPYSHYVPIERHFHLGGIVKGWTLELVEMLTEKNR